MTLDPFTVEVIRHGLSAAAEELTLTVMRSARSPLLREAGDMSSALTDAEGELIAQGHDIPIHLGVMAQTVKAFLGHVPAARLAPGDVWFLNLPGIGGNHLPDVKAIRPIFADGRLFAFAVSLAHWPDIGGAWPGSYFAAARDTWQEGLRIPLVRFFSADGPDREKLDFLLANVRSPEEREGDMMAQMAGTRAADRRVLELCAEHGTPTVTEAIQRLHQLSEAAMREAIAAIPDGHYSGEDFMDDGGPNGGPAGVRVDIEIAGDSASFDFSRSNDAVDSYLNTTPYVASAAVFYAIKAIAGPEIQPNGGCYKPLRIVTRPGSLLDPGPERPVVGGNHETSQRIVDAVMRAFEGTMGERLSAGGPTTAGGLILAGRNDAGVYRVFFELHGGGEGARIDRDGMPCVRVHLVNTANTPAEVVEAEYPIEVERQALRQGSGGAGAHRGGDGLIRAYRILAAEMTLTTVFERRVVPPHGLAGGEPGETFRVSVLRADGTSEELPGKANLMVFRGDRVLVESCGGGGYGTPG